MNIFPALQGETYPTIKRPMFSTIEQGAASGLEVRIAEYAYPLWEWEIPYSWLSQEAAISDYQALVGLILQSSGKFAAFLYSDPEDNSTAGVPALIGTGNGSLTTFQIGRTIGGAYEPLYDINSISAAPKVYLNGTLQSSGYTISATGLITFGSAVGNGVLITVDFQYYWRVKFSEDNPEFELFAKHWWESKSIKLKQVRVQ